MIERLGVTRAMYSDEKVVRNDTSVAMRVWTEPWAVEFEIPPGKSGVFSANSSVSGELEVRMVEGRPEIWFWDGTNMVVTIDGVEQMNVPDHLRVPIMSGKLSMKETVRLLFRTAPEDWPKKKWWKFWK